jgi:hypothetical protein
MAAATKPLIEFNCEVESNVVCRAHLRCHAGCFDGAVEPMARSVDDLDVQYELEVQTEHEDIATVMSSAVSAAKIPQAQLER